ncbi:ferredoxin III, nif-specific [Thermocoleostomius sinensis]|jgi:Nif-specific ferredoxin III|uniref:Ferredoxin III n=1 Tax=Thermocoleostomius sinensis A174 TaxID=2016057 RepID=A0A9E8ZBN1_9CYAN|nr:ferredoxin III, nif-specific [Thermocoleostomius sinensis]WAL58433.1 ferredoxin III, nif-specific [Thermocoleostomius sinensis A174]
MAVLTGSTFGQKTWTPQFVQAINHAKCLGCGRCFKVCGRNVLHLQAMNDEGEFVEDEDEDEIERKVMTIVHQENCIGCQACSRICPKNCYTHIPLALN